ncbi:Crp/Fnr family transcriptional regulator [Sphingomonas morindae]|uniref:Crp/Fnr family transcriptional regulator n=1 Tax=Sphingomonas morindae TaxID=1541170 RepID=A0ABY4XDK7_9SPHN|nr:Crp/Fnr family transcriptional regulator [Sphingomonas morindae]USI74846.1 Crp/Fnr family transcriptional regulator [Sphingomonas morindae]
MSQLPLQRCLAFLDLSPSERATLDAMAGPPTPLPKRAVIRAEGDAVDTIFFLLEGWVTSSLSLPNGDRQIVKLHLPGDMLGTPSMVLAQAAETLTAITPVRLCRMSLSDYGQLFVRAPRLAAVLFLCAQQERITLMDRITSLSRTSAAQRLAALLLHIDERLRLGEPGRAPMLDLPLTQEQIGDMTGLTAVHVNRTFRELELMGLITRRGRQVGLADLERLRQFAALPPRVWVRDPSWLPAHGAEPVPAVAAA